MFYEELDGGHCAVLVLECSSVSWSVIVVAPREPNVMDTSFSGEESGW